MAAIRLVFLAMLVTVFGSTAHSEEIIWEGGGWKVALTTSDQRIIGCHGYRDYDTGTRLVLALYRNAEWRGLLGEHKGQPDFAPGPIQFRIDDRLVFNGVAERLSNNGGVRLGNLHPRVIDQLARGRVLDIISPTRPAKRLSLTGSEEALANVEKCLSAIFVTEQKAQAARGVTYRVLDTVSDGVLNLRTEPSRYATLLVSIPAGTRGLRPVGECKPSMDKESVAAWCRFQVGALTGWLTMRGLAEDAVGGPATGAVISSPHSPPPAAPVSTARPDPPRSRDSNGTGFFVSKSGHILTNAHVVKDCRSIEVSQPGLSRSVPAVVLARDRLNDLALLLAPDVKVDVLPPLRRQIRVGEDVAAFGYPLMGLVASSGNFTRGNITALAGLGDDTTHVQMAVPIQPGNSGGPVLDHHGNVVGVVVSKLNAMSMVKEAGIIPEQINFAIKGSTAASFLEAHGQSLPEPAKDVAAMSSPDLADHAKRFTVLVTCRS